MPAADDILTAMHAALADEASHAQEAEVWTQDALADENLALLADAGVPPRPTPDGVTYAPALGNAA